jgi:hypothetical protein
MAAHLRFSANIAAQETMRNGFGLFVSVENGWIIKHFFLCERDAVSRLTHETSRERRAGVSGFTFSESRSNA